MAKKKHPFEAVAEKLAAQAAKPSAGQHPSSDYWQLHSSADDDPKVALSKPNAVFQWGEREGLDQNGFPEIPIPEMQLKGRRRWTDVMSPSLPASWSVGHLVNETALAAFKQCELGTFCEYPVTVRDGKGDVRTLTYLLIRNEIQPTSVDFAKSEFYLTDIVGDPQRPVAITSFEDWSEKAVLAREGKLDGCKRFSRLAFKKLVLHRDHLPMVDLFKLRRLGIGVYITTRLKDAIESSGITGLEIQPNHKLFAG